MQKVKVDWSGAYMKNKCKMHLAHPYLKRQLLHRTVAVTELQRSVSCDVEYNTKSPPAGTEALPASRIEIVLSSITGRSAPVADRP